MKKNFITRETTLEPIKGTFNMRELKFFYGSKIMEIEDVMTIDENDIQWIESATNTQGLGLENQNMILNTEQLKLTNHQITLFPNQSVTEKSQYTKWQLVFNIDVMINKYLFAQIKRARTFAGIDNTDTTSNDIDIAIQDYITQNVKPRIRFFTINFYIKYYQIGTATETGAIALQFTPIFRQSLIEPSPIAGETTQQFQARSKTYKDSLQIKNFQITTDSQQQTATMILQQSQSSQNYKFDYYYDVVYQKA
jgi:hypothetical protein